MIPKFIKNQKVRVKGPTWKNRSGADYHWIEEMDQYIGKVYTIADIIKTKGCPCYHLKEIPCGWKEVWLSDPQEKEKSLPSEWFEI